MWRCSGSGQTAFFHNQFLFFLFIGGLTNGLSYLDTDLLLISLLWWLHSVVYHSPLSPSNVVDTLGSEDLVCLASNGLHKLQFDVYY